ncbi:MAG: hypothetical protein WC055_00750 [Melioribacteraceae bacterium]
MTKIDKEIIDAASNLIHEYAISLRDCNTIDNKWDDEELEKEFLNHLELSYQLKLIYLGESNE